MTIYLDSRSPSGVLDENYSLGAGPQFGVIHSLSNELAVEGSFSAVRYAIGDYNTERVSKLSVRYAYDKDRALRLDIESRDEFERRANAGFLRWQVFFTP